MFKMTIIMQTCMRLNKFLCTFFITFSSIAHTAYRILFLDLLRLQEAFYKLTPCSSHRKKIQRIEIWRSCEATYWPVSSHPPSRKLFVQISRHNSGVMWLSVVLLKNYFVPLSSGISSKKIWQIIS